MINQVSYQSHYASINGLQMYYEIYGQGKPLVLIHGGGSNIQTSFGRIIPLLAKNRQVIAVDMQAHGRTADRDVELSFEQDAADVVQLLKHLQLDKADILGFSNGGQTALEIAIHYPTAINKVILCSIFYKRSAVPQLFWDGFDSVTIEMLPEVLREAYLNVNNNNIDGLMNMFNRDVQRMKTFKGWSEAQLQSIQVPTLIMNGNNDVSTPEHAVEMYRLIPNSELAILPGGHGTYLGSIEALENGIWTQAYTAGLIETFLEK